MDADDLDAEEVLLLVKEWLDARPTVRGFEVDSAELRLEASIWEERRAGRLVALLNHTIEQVEANMRAAVDSFTKRPRLVTEPGSEPETYPEFAYLDFASYAELAQALRGEGGPVFYFRGEKTEELSLFHRA